MKSIVNPLLVRVSALLKAHHGGSDLSLLLAVVRNLVHWHMHPFVQIQVVMLSLCYVSIPIIGSVIERVSVYWHTVSFTSGSYSFLDAYFFNIAASKSNI